MKKILTLIMCLISFSNLAKASYEDDINIYSFPRPIEENIIYDINDKPVKLSSYKDKFLIITFWSRYCAPCLREMGSLDAYQGFVKDDGIKVILVSPDGEWFSAQEHNDFVKKLKLKNLETFFDKKGDLRRYFGILKTPHAVIINSKGEEIGRIKSSQNWKDRELVNHIYKIKAESNHQKEPLMSIGSIKSQELEPIRK